MLQFENSSWEILIVDKNFGTRFTLRNAEGGMYNWTGDHNEKDLGVLLEFIQYIEKRCKHEKVKIKITESLKKAKNDLYNNLSREPK